MTLIDTLKWETNYLFSFLFFQIWTFKRKKNKLLICVMEGDPQVRWTGIKMTIFFSWGRSALSEKKPSDILTLSKKIRNSYFIGLAMARTFLKCNAQNILQITTGRNLPIFLEHKKGGLVQWWDTPWVGYSLLGHPVPDMTVMTKRDHDLWNHMTL